MKYLPDIVFFPFLLVLILGLVGVELRRPRSPESGLDISLWSGDASRMLYLHAANNGQSIYLIEDDSNTEIQLLSYTSNLPIVKGEYEIRFFARGHTRETWSSVQLDLINDWGTRSETFWINAYTGEIIGDGAEINSAKGYGYHVRIPIFVSIDTQQWKLHLTPAAGSAPDKIRDIDERTHVGGVFLSNVSLNFVK